MSVYKKLIETIKIKNELTKELLNLNESDVGIFWVINPETLIKQSDPMKSINAVNGIVNYDRSHYNVWNELKNYYPIYKNKEYTFLPRGRIVYNEKKNKYIIFLNKENSQNKDLIKTILKEFKIKVGSYEIVTDEHYENDKYLSLFDDNSNIYVDEDL